MREPLPPPSVCALDPLVEIGGSGCVSRKDRSVLLIVFGRVDEGWLRSGHPSVCVSKPMQFEKNLPDDALLVWASIRCVNCLFELATSAATAIHMAETKV